jgi:arylsulfatase A-like enzyme
MDDDKPWKELDIESTTRELEFFLDGRANRDRPVLFYTQPIDVHELGQANIPPKTKENWRDRPGFNNKTAYQLAHADAALGKFITYLKARGLYESSIIIVTADHGDALAENGRRGHSYILFPEIVHIPLIVHLPPRLRDRLICDPNRLASLIDITPTLYYLLGHRPIRSDLVLGQPLFFESASEMQQYHRDHLLLASDVRAAYGIVTGDVRSMYITYDSPPSSWLFDLVNDPKGTHNVVTDSAREKYNGMILRDLTSIATFYGFKPSGGESGALVWEQPGSVTSGYFARPKSR